MESLGFLTQARDKLLPTRARAWRPTHEASWARQSWHPAHLQRMDGRRGSGVPGSFALAVGRGAVTQVLVGLSQVIAKLVMVRGQGQGPLKGS